MGSHFAGQVAVITGAASGIGRALAEALAARGAELVLADIDEAGLAALAERLRCTTRRVDVREAAVVEALIAEAWERHGRIDLALFNAGVCVAGAARDLALGDWEQVLDVNLRGVVHGVAAVYPRMAARGAGHIVNMASMVGLFPAPAVLPYTTSKFAIVGLSQALRAEARVHGVKVGVVCPQLVGTGLMEKMRVVGLDRAGFLRATAGRPLPMRDCVRTILRGVERDRAVITVGALSRGLWWLYRLAPGLVERILAWQARKLSELRVAGAGSR